MLVVNASNRWKIWDWVTAHLDAAHLPAAGVQAADLTVETCLIAVQGPAALKAVQPLTELELAAVKYYHAAPAKVAGQPAVVSRTGYTGEDGVEIMAAAAAAVELWEAILASGSALGAVPVGLGARDTLRLEAAMPLYGHELSETIDPLTAGLAFAVNLDGRQFPGRDALARVKQQPLTRRRIGVELTGRRVPREQYAIRRGDAPVGDAPIGEVTSGTFSPTLNRPIAMGYVSVAAAEPGVELLVDIRGQLEPARVVKLPFYRRA
jgi:aminomethyltransferase